MITDNKRQIYDLLSRYAESHAGDDTMLRMYTEAVGQCLYCDQTSELIPLDENHIEEYADAILDCLDDPEGEQGVHYRDQLVTIL